MAIQRIVLFVCMFVSFCFEIIKRLIYWKETISSKLKCQNNKKKFVMRRKNKIAGVVFLGIFFYFQIIFCYITLSCVFVCVCVCEK